jgi:hypothetical protein
MVLKLEFKIENQAHCHSGSARFPGALRGSVAHSGIPVALAFLGWAVREKLTEYEL